MALVVTLSISIIWKSEVVVIQREEAGHKPASAGTA